MNKKKNEQNVNASDKLDTHGFTSAMKETCESINATFEQRKNSDGLEMKQGNNVSPINPQEIIMDTTEKQLRRKKGTGARTTTGTDFETNMEE